MLKLNYKLERKETIKGKEVPVTYQPDNSITDIPGSITLVKAPNGNGKSTALNILSAAFYGANASSGDGNKISPSLQEKIHDLYYGNDQKLSFNIILTTPDGDVQLQSKKDKNSDDLDIRETINGKTKTLSKEEFQKRYYLIYDIPTDPVKKMLELPNAVKAQQQDYLLKISKIKAEIENIKKDIIYARDENKILESKSKIDRYRKDISDLTNNTKILQDNINYLNAYSSIVKYQDYNDRISRLSILLDDLEFADVTPVIKKNIKDSNESFRFQRVSNDINTLIGKIQNIYNNLYEIDRLEVDIISNNIDEISNISPSKSLKNNDFNPSLFEETINTLKSVSQSLSNKEEESEAIVKNEFYRKILDILEVYKNRDVQIPGVSTSLPNIVNSILEEMKNNSDIVNKYKKLSDTKTLLNNVEPLFKRILGDIKGLHLENNPIDEEPVSKNESKTKAEEYKSEIKEYKNQIEILTKSLSTLGFNNSDYENKEKCKICLTELSLKCNDKYRKILDSGCDMIDAKVNNLSAELLGLNSKIKEIQNNLSYEEVNFKKLDIAKPSKYSHCKDFVNKLDAAANSIEFNLNKYNRTIEKIKNKSGVPLDPVEIKYNDMLSIYLSQKIRVVMSQQTEYYTKSIDLYNGIIISTDGTKIKTNNLSTGESMSAYLQSLLNSDDDPYNRRYIVLFDEINTMDRKSLKPIINKLRDLKNKNRLMMGMLVHALLDGKDFEIVSLDGDLNE